MRLKVSISVGLYRGAQKRDFKTLFENTIGNNVITQNVKIV